MRIIDRLKYERHVDAFTQADTQLPTTTNEMRAAALAVVDALNGGRKLDQRIEGERTSNGALMQAVLDGNPSQKSVHIVTV